MRRLLLLLLILLHSPSFATEKPKDPVSSLDPEWMIRAGFNYSVFPYEPEPLVLVPKTVVFFKRFLYDQYTLADTYEYQGRERGFQWDKMMGVINRLDSLYDSSPRWAVIQNYKNKNGRAPYVHNVRENEHKQVSDAYGVGRNQSVPFYTEADSLVPQRYGRDGSLVAILQDADSTGFMRISNVNFEGEWLVPQQYVVPLTDSLTVFDKLIFVDRANQNIATMERDGIIWYVRSMNPATTGRHLPPYMQETPLGIFLLQEKKEKMWYLVDGTNDIAGFAPNANRFSNGAYIHGVATSNPETKVAPEFSWSLGTTPRSHMCVRNASSHALFIRNWAPTMATLIIVIE